MAKKIKDDEVTGTCNMHRLREEWSEYARIKVDIKKLLQKSNNITLSTKEMGCRKLA